jgi:hypothetical protein
VNASRSLKSIFLAAVVVVATSGFAASKGSVELQHPTNVGGKQLASGSYRVQWEGTGDQVELKFYQGKNVVASTSARLVTLERPLPNDAILVSANGDGSASLSRINFGGKKYALEIAGEAGASGASGAAR